MTDLIDALGVAEILTAGVKLPPTIVEALSGVELSTTRVLATASFPVYSTLDKSDPTRKIVGQALDVIVLVDGADADDGIKASQSCTTRDEFAVIQSLLSKVMLKDSAKSEDTVVKDSDGNPTTRVFTGKTALTFFNDRAQTMVASAEQKAALNSDEGWQMPSA